MKYNTDFLTCDLLLVTSPSGKKRNFPYTAGRLTGESNTANEIIAAYSYSLNISPLSLSYDGNRLTAVDDTLALTYDLDGRLRSDASRGISLIKYAPNDRPVRITDEAGNSMSYEYDAAGNKLSEQQDIRLTDAGSWEMVSEPRRVYAGPFEFLIDDDGNVTLDRTDLQWGYLDSDHREQRYITDHQGNVRAVTDALGHISQATDYTPYGTPVAMSLPGSGVASANRYLYSGKEWSEPLSAYDFHARTYAPATLTFSRPDPLAAKYPHLNPYLYCAANPLRYTDPTGNYFVDKNTGNRVNYSTEHGSFIDNTDSHLSKYQHYMQKTATGSTIFNEIANNEIATTVTFTDNYESNNDRGSTPPKDIDHTYGMANVDKGSGIDAGNKKGNDKSSAEIQIFLNPITNDCYKYWDSRNINPKSAKAKIRNIILISLDQFIASVCAHEGRHATDLEDLPETGGKLSDEQNARREERADATEIATLWESSLK